MGSLLLKCLVAASWWVAPAAAASCDCSSSSSSSSSAAAYIPPAGQIGGQTFGGYYADPEIREYDGTYWIFPTTSVRFADQTYLDAWSSADLRAWTQHARVLTTAAVPWARDSLWAPASFRRNGRYYLYFSANGLRSQQADAGLGVAVAARPEGPYRDALGGRRLVGDVVNGANPMDADVFCDEADGQTYLYFGGTTVNVALLNDDMVSFGALPGDGAVFRNITPTPSFVEGTEVFKRKGIYYMMWSENGYGDPTYQVSYGMSDSPLGPFAVQEVVLQQNTSVAVATGHNSVLNLPGTDRWVIVYHRRAVGETVADNRVVALNEMFFRDDGTIVPVVIS